MTADDLPLDLHRTPDGVSDATVEALGKLSEALETCERARGHLYSFHQLTGSADIALGDAVAALRDAGHHQVADRIDTDLVGRNVLHGRWTKTTTTTTGRCSATLKPTPVNNWREDVDTCTKPG
jgi:hypothetical protein